MAFYQSNALSEKLGFFLYLFIGYYKGIDIVLHEKLLVSLKIEANISDKYIKKILFMLFASAAALNRTSLQADRSLIALSVA